MTSTSASQQPSGSSAAAPIYTTTVPLAKPPDPLNLEDRSRRGDNWLHFKRAWQIYERAAGISQKDGPVRVAHFLNIVGREGVQLFDTFTFAEDESADNIDDVLAKFESRCLPQRNQTYERYLFNKREQEPGESVDQYCTALMRLSEHCGFLTLRDSLIRDRLILGVKNDRSRKKLLEKKDLTLDNALDILRTQELTDIRALDMTTEEANVNRVKAKKTKPPKTQTEDTTPHKHTSGKKRTPPWKSREKSSGNPDNVYTRECKFCGTVHEMKKSACPAVGKKCTKCGRDGHFAKKCHSRSVNHVQDCEIYSHKPSPTSAYVTACLNNNAQVQLQIDTGASCNILPKSAYIRATGDKQCTNLEQSFTRLIMHNKTVVFPLGQMRLLTERKGRKYGVLYHIVKQDLTPLLCRTTCEKMNLVKILDADVNAIHDERIDVSSNVRSDPILYEFTDIFTGIGCLEGTYSIQVDEGFRPVVHPPRKVPVPLRDTLKLELDNMVKSGILAKVVEPTSWVSSLVIVKKSNGKIRVCLDPRDLNRAVKRSHYPLPTIEEVATRLSGAKVFSVLDAKCGFWQVQLDEKSSYLTTMNTPFGRYRWLRMPFGINSAPEVWQQRMHELVEGLAGVEVIADDFLVCGFGDSNEAAIANHDQNLKAFLSRARERNLTLNSEKLKLRQSQVPFIGHLLTAEGLKPDPSKVQAIVDYPVPTNLAELRTFLGMVQYLAKFCQHLSTASQPLRQLEKKEIEWHWQHPQDKAFKEIKELITKAPVLQYFDVSKNVTIQCDASQYGIGATLLQEGQPVHYANRALTSTEQNYAQIEKELLAVVFSCEHFEHYIYGKHVTVETDHKPLIAIQKKPINTASKRLQRMMLRLQRFDLNLTYKPGKEMYIADALSRVLPKQSKVPNASTSSCYKDLETVNFVEDLSISESTLAKFQVETAKDESLLALSQVIRAGWPTKTSMVPTSAQLFFKYRDEMTLQNGLVFKGTKIVVPESLRRDMIEETHKSHQGLQACLRRAREVFFWPGMSAQLKNRIDKCSICQSVRPEQASEPLQPHPVPDRPWQRVGTDLFTFENRNYLVLVDYYSNFIELDHLADTTSQTVVHKLKMHFSRHGVPDYVVSDNGPQYSSSEFRRFAVTWKFTHITTSPHYPQANGMAESAVKTCKTLMKKALLSQSDPYLGLLDHHNTPTAATGMSPCQRLFGRRTKTLLPFSESLLKTDQTVSDLLKRDRVKQAKHFDQHAKQLSELKSGDIVRMKMPGETKWSKAVVSSKVASRSYKVEVNGRFYRRNRKQLRSTMEPLQETPFKMDEDDLTVPDNLQEQDQPPPASSQVGTSMSPPRSQLPPTPQTELSARPPHEATTTEIRTRHGRLIKPPKKFDIEL